ncbi:hypothetical protein [Legionella sp. WA2022007384]
MARSRSKSESDVSNSTKTGNRIIRADYDEHMEGTIVLYRGIRPHEGKLFEGKTYETNLHEEQTREKQSVIGPKKPLDQNISVGDHIDGATDSSYTSWTPAYDVANRFANKEGKGTVMRGVFRKEDLTHPVENFEGEIEYSVRGTVVGAKRQLAEPPNVKETTEQARKQWYKESRELGSKNYLHDPLAKGSSITHEFSPTGELQRTWKTRRYNKTLVDDIGTPEQTDKNEERRQRSKTVGDNPDIFSKKSYQHATVEKTSKVETVKQSKEEVDIPAPSSITTSKPLEEKQEKSALTETTKKSLASLAISKFKAFKKSLNESNGDEEKLTSKEKSEGVDLPKFEPK